MCASEMLSSRSSPRTLQTNIVPNSTTSQYVAFGDGQRFVAMVPVGSEASRRSLIGQAFSRSEKLNLKPIPEQFSRHDLARRRCTTDYVREHGGVVLTRDSPDLAIEILSPSTKSNDRGRKMKPAREARRPGVLARRSGRDAFG